MSLCVTSQLSKGPLDDKLLFSQLNTEINKKKKNYKETFIETKN